MSDITELERRITAALDRIGSGIETLGATGSDGASAELAEQLEAERTANAQLEERVKAIREKQETVVGTLEAEVTKLREEIAGHFSEMSRMQQINSQLRENNAALREANAEGVGDAHLINKAMLTELEALRSARAADRAELDAVLDELRPLAVAEGGADA